MEFVEKLISSIVDNRQMPKVQVEREISPILDIFLEGFMNNLAKEKIIKSGTYKFIAPEFPLSNSRYRTGTQDINNLAFNIDYLMINNKTLYFIELKTDSSSFKYEQFEKYKRVMAANNGSDLYAFLDKLSEKQVKYKKLLNEVDTKTKDLDIANFNNIESIELLYIAPKKMLSKKKRIEDKWVEIKDLDFNNEIKFKDIHISFEDLHSYNNFEHKYSAEWKIITSYLIKLDEN